MIKLLHLKSSLDEAYNLATLSCERLLTHAFKYQTDEETLNGLYVELQRQTEQYLAVVQRFNAAAAPLLPPDDIYFINPDDSKLDLP